ncbi:hypothetical protein DVH24_039672 [Malus domestica]|uniref:Uncharacterized protein n=1 Tax=Malus domestica TaxID=3750 RepID=A0A498I862_MALDO|nr:hypothetical protein DVH24_039672 [Malus domestica]
MRASPDNISEAWGPRCRRPNVTVGGHIAFSLTHDPITGNEMLLREMWSLIHTNYLEKIGGKIIKESMSGHWRILSQSFSLWRDALAKTSSNLQSGENLVDQHEAFWELNGFGFHRNSEVKRVWARAFLGWVTHWEVLV